MATASDGHHRTLTDKRWQVRQAAVLAARFTTWLRDEKVNAIRQVLDVRLDKELE